MKLIFLVVSVLLVATYFAGLCLNTQQHANKKIENICSQMGWTINYTAVDYNPWKGHLALSNAELILGNGLSIKADNLFFSISIISLWQDATCLSQITINKSSITLNIKECNHWGGCIDCLKILGVEKIELKDGLFFIEDNGEPYCLLNLPCHIYLEQLTIHNTHPKASRVFASGSVGGGNWCYNGRIKETVFPMLKGELEFDRVALKDIERFLVTDGDEIEVGGDLSGNVSLYWDSVCGVGVSGNLTVGSGYVFSPALKLSWANANIVRLRYSSRRPFWQASELRLGQAAINYNVAELGRRVAASRLRTPIVIQALTAKNAQIESTGTGLLAGKLISADLSVRPGEKSIVYDLTGLLPEQTGTVAAKGVISGLGPDICHLFELDISGLDTGNGNNLNKIGAYDIGKAQVSVNMNGEDVNGRINVRTRYSLKMQDSNQVPLDNGYLHKLLLALMMDSWGYIRVSVSTDHVSSEKPLRDLLIDALEQYWNTVSISPYKYLSSLDASTLPLCTTAVFEPGMDILDVDILNNIERWVLILKQRPALGLAIEGRSSVKQDGVILARITFEDSLLNYYKLEYKKQQSGVKIVVPENARNDLIRRMYLSYNKKLPKAGGGKGSIKQAEEWLLKHYPYHSKLLAGLADNRASHIIDALIHAGIEPERIRRLPSVVADDGLVSRLILEHFTLPACK